MMHSIFDNEPRPCVMVRLTCEKCGPVRMALAPQDEPITTLECPYCSAIGKVQQLGTGQTIRILPFFEFEANLDRLNRTPAAVGAFRRLTPGQLVVFCQEKNILHLASVGEVWVDQASLGSDGQPSISFRIDGLDTGPVPHFSGVDSCPPWWCLPEEIKPAMKVKKRKAK